MKNLDLLQEKLEISKEEMPEYVDVVQNVKAIIDQNQIHFKENPEFAFYAHIINFARRLKARESLTMAFEEYREEVSPEFYQVADQIVRQICDRYGCEMDPSEVILVAIHIQATLF